jgi:hypothetical protein
MSKYVLTISRQGVEERSYSDEERERFLTVTKTLINEHLDKSIRSGQDLKNTQIHIYTDS